VHSTLLIVGDGPEEENLKLIAKQKELNNKIKFLGFRKDAGSLISNADLLLLTSDHEGVPTVILEAASYGVPIVCTKLAGIQEALSKLVDYPVFYGVKGSVQSFEEAINEAFDKHPPGGSLNKSPEFEKWFTPKAVARQHIEIYKSLIEV
jgi:glycosyltransferase involved in cell wall biosynthesis